MFEWTSWPSQPEILAAGLKIFAMIRLSRASGRPAGLNASMPTAFPQLVWLPRRGLTRRGVGAHPGAHARTPRRYTLR